MFDLQRYCTAHEEKVNCVLGVEVSDGDCDDKGNYNEEMLILAVLDAGGNAVKIPAPKYRYTQADKKRNTNWGQEAEENKTIALNNLADAFKDVWDGNSAGVVCNLNGSHYTCVIRLSTGLVEIDSMYNPPKPPGSDPKILATHFIDRANYTSAFIVNGPG